ncbi:MAG: hypothetical protein Q9168_005224 [Polycauliona sp. 1 TL-2023]
MKAQEATLFYGHASDVQHTIRSGSTALENFGTVSPVVFHRDFISFAYTAAGKSGIGRLDKADFTIQSLTTEIPALTPDERVLIARIKCHKFPTFEFDSEAETIPKADTCPLERSSRQMKFISLHLTVERNSWLVSSGKKGRRIDNQLRRFMALYYNYPTFGWNWIATQPENNPRPNIKNETLSEDTSTASPILEGILEAAKSPRSPATDNTRAISLLLPKKIQEMSMRLLSRQIKRFDQTSSFFQHASFIQRSSFVQHSHRNEHSRCNQNSHYNWPPAATNSPATARLPALTPTQGSTGSPALIYPLVLFRLPARTTTPASTSLPALISPPASASLPASTTIPASTNVPASISPKASSSLPRPTSLPIPSNSQIARMTSIESLPASTEPKHPMSMKRKLDEMVSRYTTIEKEENEITARCRDKKARLWRKWHNGQPTPTSPEHLSRLRQRLEEMEMDYNKVEKEEADAVALCSERKAQVWQEHSGPTPLSAVPPHPATLKRELKKMTVRYDEIERQEEEHIVRCREKKERLWQEFFHRAGFHFKPLGGP